MIQYQYDREGHATCRNDSGLTFYLQGQPPARATEAHSPATLPVTKRPSWLPAIARGTSRPAAR